MNKFIIVSDFGKDINEAAHNNFWTIEAKNGDSDEWTKIADFDTFLSFNGKHESQIVQNPVELGQFRSVNKIRKPDVCVVELAKGGVQSDIQLVLDNLKKYKDSTDLLRVYTPFCTLENMNLIGLDYSFKSNENASMLVVKLQLQEVRFGSPTLEYSVENVKNAQDSKTQDMGIKEPEPIVITYPDGSTTTI